MNEKLQKLRVAREKEIKYRTERDKLLEIFLADLEVVKQLEFTKKYREELENEIRDEVINKFKETGEKKFGQLGIRLMTAYDYSDEDALTWAKEHDLCLALDKTAFKKQLKINLLDFVKVEEIPTATIPVEIKEE